MSSFRTTRISPRIRTDSPSSRIKFRTPRRGVNPSGSLITHPPRQFSMRSSFQLPRHSPIGVACHFDIDRRSCLNLRRLTRRHRSWRSLSLVCAGCWSIGGLDRAVRPLGLPIGVSSPGARCAVCGVRLSYMRSIPQTLRADSLAAFAIWSFASLYAGDVSGNPRRLYCSPALLLSCSRAKPAPPSPFANLIHFTGGVIDQTVNPLFQLLDHPESKNVLRLTPVRRWSTSTLSLVC